VVALMLEANPHLGYRDVQEILAYSAWHPDNQDWKTNGASNFNLGGLQFNDQTGFGVVDAYSAVRLAQSWTKQSTALNEVSASARKFGLTDAIPDGDGTSYSQTFAIDANMLVEHVELGVDLRHTRLGDLVIELVSPSGTVSTLMNRPTVNSEQPFGLSGMDSGVPTHLLWDFSSVQFWGEQASGDWTIRVKDVRAEEAGTLSSLSLRLYGERDTGNNVYVFNEEGFQSATHRVLNDEAGIDTLNAAPMQHDMYVDLPQGIIAAEGVTYTVSSWSVLENIVTGIGSDNVIANDANNLIRTFEGNDTLQGGKGDDTLDGGAGFDVATYSGNMEEFRVSWNPNLKTVTVVDGKSENGNEGADTLMGIERIVFRNGELNLAATVGNKAPTATQQLFDTPVFIGKGMGIDYAIPESAFTDPEQGNAADLQVTVTSASGGELPEWLAYDPATRSFSGVPPQDYQGQLKLLVTAVDDFNQSVSDILTLQFGSNQSPLLASPSELSLKEDAPPTSLALNVPTDPEGKTVRVKVLEIPAQGKLLDKQGNPLTVDAFLTADGLSEVHYQPAADINGDMGYFRYQAIDEDGVTAESAVHLFVDPVNDAPRFATSGSKLMVQYPLTQAVTLDIARPSDPESTLSQVTIVDLPVMGVVRLGTVAVSLNQVLSFDQLGRLSFTLAENVNGPIGGLTVRATDPQGLSTDWTLSLEVQGNNVNNTGTSGPDAMYGSNAADTLYGMGGDDLLVGNAGNDRLLGGLGNDTLLGGAGNDALDGSSGNDELDGGPGNDTMSGGPGNDTYTVDSASDVVLEVISGGAGGKDLVVTSVSLTAPANIESLQALPGQALNLTGNSLDNILSGNEMANSLAGGVGRDTLIGGAGNDTLDGGAGVDRLAGGLGDDTYYVDSRSDVIVELANEGTDTVYASASYTLPSQVEILILQEGGDYSAGGNSLNNRLEGNSGNNVLAGGLGKDTLVGGLGNDIYVLSDNLDTLVDAGGIDTIRSSLDIVLATDFENAELVGIADATATGNAADNLLQGNMGDNILEGKGGVDTLSGGAGSDQFVLGYNGLNTVADQITDFVSGQDLLVIDLASFGISSANLSLQSSGTLNAASFVKGPGVRALDTNDYFLLDTAQSLLKFDPDGSGPLAALDVVRFVGVVDAAFNGADLFIAV
jgi:Ca2+-binding RTX toxin-like protein